MRLPEWESEKNLVQAERIVRSYEACTGRGLLSGSLSGKALAKALFDAPFVVVSHGVEPDPVLNYGNRAALALWEMTWGELTCTPSRLTAEAPLREERERLLDRVRTNGFIDDYSGVRISKNGRRFEIRRATVWNIRDETGAHCGQAASFSEWVPAAQ